jgi:hypothetical protein
VNGLMSERHEKAWVFLFFPACSWAFSSSAAFVRASGRWAFWPLAFLVHTLLVLMLFFFSCTSMGTAMGLGCT